MKKTILAGAVSALALTAGAAHGSSGDPIIAAASDNIGPFASDNIGPFASDNIGPFASDNIGPFASDNIGPFASDNIGPFASDNIGPFMALIGLASDNIGPFASDNIGPFASDNIGPFASDNIGPFASDNIGPFASDNIGPFASDNIGPFASDNIGPFASDNIGPFSYVALVSDNIGPFASDNIGPFVSDNIGPFVSDNIGPFASDNLGPFVSDNIGPFASDNIGPFSDNIGPFYAAYGALYGSVAPFYMNSGPGFFSAMASYYGSALGGVVSVSGGGLGAAASDNIGPFASDNIGPFASDNIGPFASDNIGPFASDNIGPFASDNIGPFASDNIGPFASDNIGPFASDNIGPFSLIALASDNIGPFASDNIGPFTSDNIGPFTSDNIGPFASDNIGPFASDNIGPFVSDNIGPFASDNIGPFASDNIGPFASDNIGPFVSDNIGPFNAISAYWSQVGTAWSYMNAVWGSLGAYGSESADGYGWVQNEFTQFVSLSEAAWGDLIASEGESFDAVIAPLFDKYGLDLDDAQSFADMSAGERGYFFLEWHDTLMSFSGFDALDHWMPTINWSPAMSAAYGAGEGVSVGLLDFSIAGHDDLLDNLSFVGGSDYVANGHGTAVLGLIAADYDGQGVMGLAPNADIAAYNPFDADNMGTWTELRAGIAALGEQGVSIINMSLGITDRTLDQNWANVFADSLVQDAAGDALFIKAAGNTGVYQELNVSWDFDNDAALLLVGSADVFGQISPFSNTPGEACLLDDGVCLEENKLKYRYLVAPGELILTAGADGGLERRFGTSFSAPLVTGAAILLQSRWPWLQAHPHETADILLRSAVDLGEPGVDPIYGWGMLDVAASQAPLDLSAFVHYADIDGQSVARPLQDLGRAGLTTDQVWRAGPAVAHVFEPIGETYRDFQIGVGAFMIGQNPYLTSDRERQEFYLAERMANGMDGFGFGDRVSRTSDLTADGDWRMTMTVSRRNPLERTPDNALPFQTDLLFANESRGLAFRAGHGEGAPAIHGQDAFTAFSDFDGETGGANPILGLASGGAYADAAVTLGARLRLSAGVTHQDRRHVYTAPYSREQRPLFESLEGYEAAAMNVGARFELVQGLSLDAAYTRLYETDGLLGVQGFGPVSLGQADTDAASLGVNLDMPRGVSISLTGTLGRTQTNGLGAEGVKVTDDVLSTAFQLTAAKDGVLAKSDRLRLTLAQPLHVESGALRFDSTLVVDRETGALGVDGQSFGLGGDERDFLAEASYATSILDGRGRLGAFGRAEWSDRAATASEAGFAFGARLGLDF